MGMKQPELVKNPGYHLRDIPKGTIGESSKILEEVLELQDAEEQNATMMALVELSDVVGAIELYLANRHPSITFEDLVLMSRITQRAFQNGRRT
jgi:hypothetical protein